MDANVGEATAMVRWLLEAGLDGLGLTKTLALRRAVVREAAERWPHWWRHELFGPPHRESDLPVLAEVHAALRRLRLMRRRRETLLTTARGRELLADPVALMKVLHDDLGGDGFDGDAWLLIEGVLREHGPLESDRLTEALGRLLVVEGWRDADGARLEGWALFGALQPVLCRAEGYGLVRRHREPLRIELTAAGHGLAALEPPAPEPITPAAGDAALVFDAELLNVRGVRARLAVLERQPLTALHDAIQQAFGWYDDHLFSFWLDGSFFGSDEVELTSPDTPDEGVATADVPLAELDLHLGPANRLRVRLRRRLARPPDGTRAGHRRAGRSSSCAAASRHAATAVPGARRLDLMTGPQADRDPRLAFAIPLLAEPDEETQRLDPNDADDRALLIAAAHPELDTDAETALVDGHEINPRLHLTIHEIVATQIVDDDPPEVWATAQRLRKLGYGRHEVLHMLGAAMTPQLWAALHDQRDYDLEAHRAALAALPESWERARPGGPAPPAARAAHAVDAKQRRKAERAARRRNRRR